MILEGFCTKTLLVPMEMRSSQRSVLMSKPLPPNTGGKKKIIPTPIASSNGSKTSGTPSPTSPKKFDAKNPFNAGTPQQVIGDKNYSELQADLKADDDAATEMANRLRPAMQAYQANNPEVDQNAVMQGNAQANSETITQSVEDTNPVMNRMKYFGNSILKGVGTLNNALGDAILNLQVKSGMAPKELLTAYRKEISPGLRENFNDQLGADLNKDIEADYNNETFTGAVGGLAKTLPAIALTAGSGGLGTGALFLQSYDDALSAIDQSEVGQSLDDDTKTIYASGIGVVSAALEKFGLDKILKGNTNIVSRLLTDKAIESATKETGGKITGDVLTKFLNKEIVDFSKGFAKSGAKVVDSYLTEYATGAGQETANIIGEKLLNKATGKPVFDTSKTDTWSGFLKRVNDAGNAEGIGGGLLGSVASLGGFKGNKVKEMEQSISTINQSLANEAISDIAKEALVQQKVGLQNDLQEVADAVDKNYNALSSKQKEQVAQLVEQKAKIEESILDVNVPDDAKKLLQAQADLLDKELAEIKPVEEVKTEKEVITPIVEETVAEEVKPVKTKGYDDSIVEEIFNKVQSSKLPVEEKSDLLQKNIKNAGISDSDFRELIDTNEEGDLYMEAEKKLSEILNDQKAEDEFYAQFKNGAGITDIVKKIREVQPVNKNVEAQEVPIAEKTTELAPPKTYGYEDIDAMTDEKEIANNLYDEIVEPTELSPVEQAVRNAGGFNTTEESFARFSDRNNINQQMAKSYFKKGAQSLDQIAQSLSKDGLEVTPQDLADYMQKYNDGNSTYSGRANALRQKLQDLTGKKYNKFTVKKYIDKINDEALTKIKAQPEIIDQQTVEIINNEKIDSSNIDSLKDKIEFVYDEQTFNNIKEYLNGNEKTNRRGTDESSAEPTQTSGGSGGLEEQPTGGEINGEAKSGTVKATVLDAPQSVKDAGYELAVLPMSDGRFVAIEANSKKQISKVYDTEQEVVDAFNSNKEKFTPELIEQATGVKPKVVEEKSDAPVKEAKKDLTASERIRALQIKGKAFDAILGLPVAVYNGTLETIALAIDAGNSIAQAIKKGIAYAKSKTPELDENLAETEFRKQFEEAGAILPGITEENPVPEVIEEAEKSQEDINAEEIAMFKDRLTKAMKQAKVTTLIKSGVVKSALAVDAIKKVSDIVDHKTMLSATRAVKKVFNDVVRNAYISQVQQAKKGLNTRLKGSKLAKVDVIKKFLAIDEKKLDVKDLEAYNALSRKLNEQYNAKLEGVVGDREIQRFVDKIADKTAKAILDEQVEDFEADVEEDSDAKEISPRRKQLNAAVAINRQSLRKAEYSDKYRPVAKALLNIDTDKLSNGEMVNLNLALVNLAVNDRLVGHSDVFKKYVGEQVLAETNTKVGDKIKGLLESELGASARTFDINSKIIFKGVKDAALFQQLTGIAGISNGNSKLNNIDMKSLDADYKALQKKLGLENSNEAENRYLRAMYANATQFDSIDGQAKDFKRYKSLIKQSGEILSNSKVPREQLEGNLITELYDKYLEPFDSREEFENAFKKSNPKAVAVVDFFRNKFNDKYGELETNSQLYAGKNLGKINNYLPLKYKRHKGTDAKKGEPTENDILEPVYSFDPETGDVSEKQSSTTISRSNVAKLQEDGRVLDMDFDRVMFQKYREMNYDIRTLKDRHMYNAVKSQPGFKDVVGGSENSNVLTDGVRNMVKRQMNANYDHNKMQSILKASRIITAKSVRQALFGVSQYIKQYPSVAIRTLVNLKGNLPLFIKGVTVGANNPIFDQFGIGLRASTKGGTNFEAELNQMSKADFSGDFGKFMNKLSGVSSKYVDLISKTLTKPDEAVAKHSWIAYYLEDIQRRGGDISKVDFANEHLNPDMEAGAYADIMTSTTQNTNDNSKQADVLYDNSDGWTIIKNIIAPMSSFARNSQANLEADLRMFSGGTKAEQAKARLGITATVIESIAFNTVKIALISPLIKVIASSITGNEPDEEKESKTSKILKNSTSDVLFSGLGSLANYWAIKGVNQANKAVTGAHKDLFFQYDPARYGEPDFGMAGIYGIMPQLLYNMGKKVDYLDGVTEGKYEDAKGRVFEVKNELTKKEQATVSILFIMDALALSGFSEAEVNRIGQGVFREINKDKAPIKSFKIEYPNKKGGATKERIE